MQSFKPTRAVLECVYGPVDNGRHGVSSCCSQVRRKLHVDPEALITAINESQKSTYQSARPPAAAARY